MKEVKIVFWVFLLLLNGLLINPVEADIYEKLYNPDSHENLNVKLWEPGPGPNVGDKTTVTFNVSEHDDKCLIEAAIIVTSHKSFEFNDLRMYYDNYGLHSWQLNENGEAETIYVTEALQRGLGDCAKKSDDITFIFSLNWAEPGTYGKVSRVQLRCVFEDPPPVPPTATIINPSTNTTVSQGEVVNFSGQGYSSNGPIISYYWEFHGGSPSSSSLQNPGAVTFNEVGNHLVEFTIEDSVGLTAKDSITINTVNTPPTATINSPSGDIVTIYQGQSVFFNGSGTDPGGISSCYWDFDGAALGVKNHQPGNITFNDLGIYYCGFYVTDNDGVTSKEVVAVNVIDACSTAPNGTEYFANQGDDGWWDVTGFISADSVTNRVVSGDYNGDGRDDICMLIDYGSDETRAHVLLSDGSEFQSSIAWKRLTDFNADHVSGRVVSGNFNGDEFDDIAMIYKNNNCQTRVDVLLSNGVNHFEYATWWNKSGYCTDQVTDRVVSGDFDGDGDDDICMFYDYGNNETRAHVLLSSIDSSSKRYFEYSNHNAGWWTKTNYTASNISGRVVSGDYDGDGLDDIAMLYDYGFNQTCDRNEIAAHVLLSSGSADVGFKYSGDDDGWWRTCGYTAGQITGRVVSGDFNNDGLDDVSMISYNSSHETRASVLISTGSVDDGFQYQGGMGWWAAIPDCYDATEITNRVVSGDFDLNGRDDIAMIYDKGILQMAVHVLLSNEIDLIQARTNESLMIDYGNAGLFTFDGDNFEEIKDVNGKLINADIMLPWYDMNEVYIHEDDNPNYYLYIYDGTTPVIPNDSTAIEDALFWRDYIVFNYPEAGQPIQLFGGPEPCAPCDLLGPISQGTILYNPENMIEWRGNLVADYGSNGLFVYDGAKWNEIDYEGISIDADIIVPSAESELIYIYEDDNPNYYVYEYNEIDPTIRHDFAQIEDMLYWRGYMVFNYPESDSLLRLLGGPEDYWFVGLHGPVVQDTELFNPVSLTVWGNNLVANYGPYGVWYYDGVTWHAVKTSTGFGLINAEDMISVNIP